MSRTISEDNFVDEVIQSPVPVLVHFWAPWCGLCRRIEPLLNHFQGEWGEQLRVVGINADENLKLANRFKLNTLPTLLFVESGEVKQRLDSFRGQDDLRQMLHMLMNRYQLESSYLMSQPYQSVDVEH